MDFGLNSFKATPVGRRVAAVLASTEIREDLRVLSRYGFPAAMALGRPLLAIQAHWSDGDKKHVGRWIKEEMAAQGLVPVLKAKRVPPGYLFSVGAVYGPAGG